MLILMTDSIFTANGPKADEAVSHSECVAVVSSLDFNKRTAIDCYGDDHCFILQQYELFDIYV